MISSVQLQTIFPLAHQRIDAFIGLLRPGRTAEILAAGASRAGHMAGGHA
jgi:hypothetical protein